MASIEDALIAFLGAAPAVTALVGTEPARICPALVPQALPFPRLVVTKTSDEPGYSNAGDVGPGRANFEIECQGKTMTEAATLRDVVRPLLSGYQGPMGARRCSRCFITDDVDTPYPAVHGEEKGVMAKVLQIEVDYS